MKWIIDLLNFEIFKKSQKKENWEPEPLYIRLPEPDNSSEEEEEEEEETVIIIDI